MGDFSNIYLFVFGVTAPRVGLGLLIPEVSRSHTTTHHSRQDSSGRVISSSQRNLLDNTQQSQQTKVHFSGGIRTHNLSIRATEDLRLRPHGHWDQLSQILQNVYYNTTVVFLICSFEINDKVLCQTELCELK